jgi:23S rRNA (guanosine2251-2'-O)-methyltransferase
MSEPRGSGGRRNGKAGGAKGGGRAAQGGSTGRTDRSSGRPTERAPGSGAPRVSGSKSAESQKRGKGAGAPPTGAGPGGRRVMTSAAPETGEQVEGRQAVRELLRARRRGVHWVTLADSSERSGLLDEIIALAGEAGVPVRRVGRERIDSLALTDAPQGVVASAEPLPEAELAVLVGRRSGGSPPFLVVLDGVTDPHNVGAVMRSALCAGATGLVVARHRAAHLGPTAVKAAAGAAEWLPVAVVAGIPGALSELQEAGVWTVGLDAGGTVAVWDLNVATEPVALVLGAEGDGLSRLTRQRCELIASVPMQGPLGSLNVSAAAALGCFEVARRRLAATEA